MSEEEIVKTEGQDAIKLLCPDTYVNLNLTRLELNDWMIGQRTNPYQILGVAADCIQKRRHLRRAKQDSDVGTFYDREPDEVIWHFPASNEVQLKKKKAGDWCLSFPANTEATFTRNADGLFITFPAGKEFEDLSPVFCPDPKAPNNHEVMLVGWDDQKHAWIVQNSWGEDWGFRCHAERGTRGFAYIAYGTFGQFAAWLEARLLDKKLWGATTT